MVSHHCLYMTRWEMPFQCEILNGLQNDVNLWYISWWIDQFQKDNTLREQSIDIATGKCSRTFLNLTSRGDMFSSLISWWGCVSTKYVPQHFWKCLWKLMTVPNSETRTFNIGSVTWLFFSHYCQWWNTISLRNDAKYGTMVHWLFSTFPVLSYKSWRCSIIIYFVRKHRSQWIEVLNSTCSKLMKKKWTIIGFSHTILTSSWWTW